MATVPRAADRTTADSLSSCHRARVTNPAIAYLALGSNLGDPIGQLIQARAAINEISGVNITSASSLYESPAWGSDEPQPDYINAVVAVQTTLSPHALWSATAKIEIAQGRIRSLLGVPVERNAARTLDIDLLLFADLQLRTGDLTLPHPRMFERDFVLLPLVEIAPRVVIAGHGTATQCLERIAHINTRKLSPNFLWN